ncbi:NAD(P)H-quinone oxidoreductase subunit L, chloroplastic isoform X2 [Amborella trichopoda]|uniref:NAD(P)H-quinone oxidoreductase subunit L, chloroplastic isoform X2 n=1 Tax=Amborella trichopoda TaxID=13333 RepID=UPI0005D41673|nr:NAD(P)H-quinone oxidoreductase subunit L, chloroplastic isoform X2 [Amborella trichopoda]|eukprot:XP_011621199.1 NAD(P)H-quinone oxidoreductase subunit L, chloroplastic isoform X2 [Amborella trichopoda]
MEKKMSLQLPAIRAFPPSTFQPRSSSSSSRYNGTHLQFPRLYRLSTAVSTHKNNMHIACCLPQVKNNLLGEELTNEFLIKLSTFAELGILLSTAVDLPARALEVDLSEDWIWTWIEGGAVAFWYLFIMPPVIMNWLRLRWYKRKFFEFYLQFMFVFIFFPGLMLWAPFINFRRLPRDPTMEYPWSTPKDPSVKDPQSSP